MSTDLVHQPVLVEAPKYGFVPGVRVDCEIAGFRFSGLVVAVSDRIVKLFVGGRDISAYVQDDGRWEGDLY